MAEALWGQQRGNYRRNSSHIYGIHAGDRELANLNLGSGVTPLDMVTLNHSGSDYTYVLCQTENDITFADNTCNEMVLYVTPTPPVSGGPQPDWGIGNVSISAYSTFFTSVNIKSSKLFTDGTYVYVVNFVEAYNKSDAHEETWFKNAIFIHKFTYDYLVETISIAPIITATNAASANFVSYNGITYEAELCGVDVEPTTTTDGISFDSYIDCCLKDDELYGIFKYNYGQVISGNTKLYSVLFLWKLDLNTSALTVTTKAAGTSSTVTHNSFFKESIINPGAFALSDDLIFFGTNKLLLTTGLTDGSVYVYFQSGLSSFGTFADVLCKDLVTYKNGAEEYLYFYTITDEEAFERQIIAYNILDTYPYVNNRWTLDVASEADSNVNMGVVKNGDTVYLVVADDIFRVIDDTYNAGISETDGSWLRNTGVSPLFLDSETIYSFDSLNDLHISHLLKDVSICMNLDRNSSISNDAKIIALNTTSLLRTYLNPNGTYSIIFTTNPSPANESFDVVSITPTDDSTEISLTTNITINFEQNVDPNSFLTPFCRVYSGSGTTTTEYDYTYEFSTPCEDDIEYCQLTLSFSSAFPENTLINIEITDDIRSVWGSSLTSNSISFTTVAIKASNSNLNALLDIVKLTTSKNLKSIITVLAPDYIASRMMDILPDIYTISHSSIIYRLFYGIGGEIDEAYNMLSILYSDLYLKNWRLQSGTLQVNKKGLYIVKFKVAYITAPNISNIIVVASQDTTPFKIYNITKYGFNIEVMSDAVDVIFWGAVGQVGAIWESNFGDALYNNHGALIDLDRYLYFKPTISSQLADLSDVELLNIYTRDYTTQIAYPTHTPPSSSVAAEKVWLRDTEIPRADLQYRRILKAIYSALVIGPTYTGVLYGLSSFFKQPGYNFENNYIYNINAPKKEDTPLSYTIPDNIPLQRVGISVRVIDLAQIYEFDTVDFTTLSSSNAIRSVIGNIIVDRYNRSYSLDVTNQARIWYQSFEELSIDNNTGIMLKLDNELTDQALIMKSVNDDDEVDKYPLLEIYYYDSEGEVQLFTLQSQLYIEAANVFKYPYASNDFIDYTDYTYFLAGGANPARLLIRFNLSVLPKNILIKQATLKLFFSSGITQLECYREKIELSRTQLSKGKLFGPSYNDSRFNVYVYKYDLIDSSLPGDHAFGYLAHEYEVNEVTNLILRKIKPSNTQYAVYYYKERVGTTAGNIYEDRYSMKYYDRCFNSGQKGYAYINPLDNMALRKSSYLYDKKSFYRDF